MFYEDIFFGGSEIIGLVIGLMIMTALFLSFTITTKSYAGGCIGIVLGFLTSIILSLFSIYTGFIIGITIVLLVIMVLMFRARGVY